MNRAIGLLLFLCVTASGGLSQGAHSATRSGGHSQEFGLGIVLGSPTAITGKYWLDATHAVDFGFGYWWSDWADIYGDYLWHFPRAFARAPELVPYIGVGPALNFYSRSPPQNNPPPNFALWARVPFGIEWLPRTAPIGVFLELAPYIELVPGINGAFGGGLGIRYYF